MADQQAQTDTGRRYKRADVFSVHRPFQLRDADFLRLTKVPSYFPIWAHTVTAGSVIYVLTLFAQYVESRISSIPSPLTLADGLFVLFLALLVIVLQIVNRWWPNEKKRLEKKIQQHFDEQQAESVVIEPEE